MSKFKKEDKVRVRKDLKADRIYGIDYCTPEMAKYAGEIVTIKQIRNYEFNVYSIKEDKGKWNWTEEMFEEISDYISINPMNYNISSITMTADDLNRAIGRIDKLEKEIKNKGDNNNMDFEEILDIYESRAKEKVYQEEDKQVQKLVEEDEIYKIIIKAEKEVQKYEKFKDKKLYKIIGRFVTDETENKINKIKKETIDKINEIYNILEEVKAQLNAIPNDTDEKYYFAIEILKTYEILDEKGRINA